jgi:hypothetical protein
MCQDNCCKRGKRGFQGLPGVDGAFADVSVYWAVIKNQTGTNAPDDDIINDTIEGVWTRTAVGTYRYTKSGFFGATTTWFTLTNGLTSAEVRCRLEVASSNYITLKTYDNTGALADDLLEQCWIGIFVKP